MPAWITITTVAKPSINHNQPFINHRSNMKRPWINYQDHHNHHKRTIHQPPIQHQPTVSCSNHRSTISQSFNNAGHQPLINHESIINLTINSTMNQPPTTPPSPYITIHRNFPTNHQAGFSPSSTVSAHVFRYGCFGGYGFGGYVKEQENGAQLLGDFSRRTRREATVKRPWRGTAGGCEAMVKGTWWWDGEFMVVNWWFFDDGFLGCRLVGGWLVILWWLFDGWCFLWIVHWYLLDG